MTMDLGAEPDTPKILEKGSTITMALPVRGHVQIRVERLTETEAVLVTLSGHPLAGAVRFLSEQIADRLRFQVQLYDRPANLVDWFLMRTVGEGMQASSWETMLQTLVAESGGTCPSGIRHEEEILDQEKAERVEAWLADLVLARKREHLSSTAQPKQARSPGQRRRTESALGEDATI